MRPLLAAAVLLLLLAEPAFAGIGLSPADISFKGMVRGGYSEKYFTVSNPTEDPIDVNIAVTGAIGNWVTLDPQKFPLGGHAFAVFKVIIQPPIDTPNGVYIGSIMVVGRPQSPEEGGAGSVSVASAVAAPITVEVSDVQIIKPKVEWAGIADTEECRPIVATFNIRNLGNIRITPHVSFNIRNSEGILVQQYEQDTDEILPTRNAVSTVKIPYKSSTATCIPEGQYSTEVVLSAAGIVTERMTISFHIWPRGHLTISGELLEIQAPTNVTLGETARIDAVFKNTGQLPVSAILMTEIVSGAAIIDTIRGEPRDIGIGGIDKLTVYWKPASPGTYIIRAKAAFENHETETKNATMEVNPPGWWLIVGAVAIGVLIAIVLIFTRLRKKGRKSNKKGRRR